jgi:hypothetical protein
MLKKMGLIWICLFSLSSAAQPAGTPQQILEVHLDFGTLKPYFVKVIATPDGPIHALAVGADDASSRQIVPSQLGTPFPVIIHGGDVGDINLGTLVARHFDTSAGGIVTLTYYTSFHAEKLPHLDDNQSSIQFKIARDGSGFSAFKVDANNAYTIKITQALIHIAQMKIPFTQSTIPTGISGIDLE